MNNWRDAARAAGRWLWYALRAIGRGLAAIGLAVIRLLWEAFSEIVRGMSRGTGDVLRRVMPWVIGAGAIWGLLVFAPELLELLVVLAIMVLGVRIMTRGLFPAPKKKKKK
jgi:hypothetical protein